MTNHTDELDKLRLVAEIARSIAKRIQPVPQDAIDYLDTRDRIKMLIATLEDIA